MRNDKPDILIVAAHPDDEVLGCGGTIVKYVDAGSRAYPLILGEGIASRHKNREMVDKKGLSDLKAQAEEASHTMGVKKVFFSDFPDNNFDSIPILKIIKEIERIKNIIKPDIIYTHHYGDLNIDHRITYKAVLTACRPLKDETVKEIYAFEVPSSTDWSGPDKEGYFVPDRFLDVSGTIDRKIEALKRYKNEIRPYPHPRSVKGIKFLAAKRGLEAGLKFAEAFETIRKIDI